MRPEPLGQFDHVLVQVPGVGVDQPACSVERRRRPAGGRGRPTARCCSSRGSGDRRRRRPTRLRPERDAPARRRTAGSWVPGAAPRGVCQARHRCARRSRTGSLIRIGGCGRARSASHRRGWPAHPVAPRRPHSAMCGACAIWCPISRVLSASRASTRSGTAVDLGIGQRPSGVEARRSAPPAQRTGRPDGATRLAAATPISATVTVRTRSPKSITPVTRRRTDSSARSRLPAWPSLWMIWRGSAAMPSVARSTRSRPRSATAPGRLARDRSTVRLVDDQTVGDVPRHEVGVGRVIEVGERRWRSRPTSAPIPLSPRSDTVWSSSNVTPGRNVTSRTA